MKLTIFLFLSLFIVSACAPKSDVDEANAKIAELQAQTAAAQAETERIKAHALDVQAQAEKIRVEAEIAIADNKSLEAQNSQLVEKVNTKPELPITVAFRKAITGPGNVIVINTTVKSEVSVLLTLESAALGTKKQFEVHLSPSKITEIGHLEGVVINNGDTIIIENQNYEPVTVNVQV